MPDPADPLRTELARLLTLMTHARENGDVALADMLTEKAATCLMAIADAKAAPVPAPDPSQQQQQPAAQQQQQIQPDEDDEPKT